MKTLRHIADAIAKQRLSCVDAPVAGGSSRIS
jgi:3-hydroxyisobutyrate dehydrogenase-like beta-hydroxyacid dehydrogenase